MASLIHHHFFERARMSIIGLEKGAVKLVEYREEWKTCFEQEKQLLLEAVSDYAAQIEHIGSTSVPEVVAKPIIDILIGVENLEIVQKFVQNLQAAGYEYKGENGIPGREFFSKGEPRTHHLHIVITNGHIWNYHIAFRDFLRKAPDHAQQYSKLKLQLAAQFPRDRESYTDAKAPFIQNILKIATE